MFRAVVVDIHGRGFHSYMPRSSSPNANVPLQGHWHLLSPSWRRHSERSSQGLVFFHSFGWHTSIGVGTKSLIIPSGEYRMAYGWACRDYLEWWNQICGASNPWWCIKSTEDELNRHLYKGYVCRTWAMPRRHQSTPSRRRFRSEWKDIRWKGFDTMSWWMLREARQLPLRRS